jgi:RNA polymerase sigma-70 factor, ECF subfamily
MTRLEEPVRYSTLPDEELIRIVSGGNEGPFEEIVRRYEGALYGFLAKMTGDREEAKDLAQETFLRAYRGRDSFKEGGRFSTWLFAVGANVARDAGRSKQRRRAEPVREDVAAESGPLEAMERREAKEMVHRCLAKLPENYREAIVLRDIQGMAYEEAARIAGVSLSAMKVRINRARLAFRDIYRREAR